MATYKMPSLFLQFNNLDRNKSSRRFFG